MRNRTFLFILCVIAPLAWGGLFLFTYLVTPTAVLPLLVFFVLLTVALLSIFFPLLYLLHARWLKRQRHRAILRQSFRQATLLTCMLLANLALRALHSWNLLTTLIILVIAIVLELLFLARKA